MKVKIRWEESNVAGDSYVRKGSPSSHSSNYNDFGVSVTHSRLDNGVMRRSKGVRGRVLLPVHVSRFVDWSIKRKV